MLVNLTLGVIKACPKMDHFVMKKKKKKFLEIFWFLIHFLRIIDWLLRYQHNTVRGYSNHTWHFLALFLHPRYHHVTFYFQKLLIFRLTGFELCNEIQLQISNFNFKSGFVMKIKVVGTQFFNLLDQWFPTGVPRHTTCARGAANCYISLIFVPIRLVKGAAKYLK